MRRVNQLLTITIINIGILICVLFIAVTVNPRLFIRCLSVQPIGGEIYLSNADLSPLTVSQILDVHLVVERLLNGSRRKPLIVYFTTDLQFLNGYGGSFSPTAWWDGCTVNSEQNGLAVDYISLLIIGDSKVETANLIHEICHLFGGGHGPSSPEIVLDKDLSLDNLHDCYWWGLQTSIVLDWDRFDEVNHYFATWGETYALVRDELYVALQ